jgi:proton-dependent oligopeptide transporter, POT family
LIERNAVNTNTRINLAEPSFVSVGAKTIFGHPPGLFVLFFTEMWERCSYYGMRSLLMLYMTDHLITHAMNGGYVFGFGALRATLEGIYGPQSIQPLASLIYGTYTAFVYFTPFFGGILADKIIGQRKSVVIGGALMCIGHLLLTSEKTFLPGLFFLILGNGCFKPNISTQVGNLYQKDDPRRDKAFTIFYMGINLGAFLAPLICGTLGQKWGWEYGFMSAGVGMFLGLIVYLCSQRFLPTDNLSKTKAREVTHEPLTVKEWKGIGALAVLGILNVVFWGVYEQQGNTIQLFADRYVNWTIFGWKMPSTWFQTINPVFIIIFAPLFSMFWNWQARHKNEPASVMKMSIGATLLGLGFIPLILVTKGLADTQRISILWLVGCSMIWTFGELYLSPIGLSLVSKIAPARLVSMLMGVWFLSNFLGNYLTGYLGTYYEKMLRDEFFFMLTILAVLTGAAIFALNKPLKKAIGGV